MNIEQKYLDSREVAEMVDKNHYDLLKDIRRYITYLTKGNFTLSDFFKESTYKDTTGRELSCYLVSKKGCEFIAHKLTGEKGTIFTARYIDKFHEMEDYISKPKSQLEVLQIAVNQLVEQEQRLAKVEDDIKRVEAKIVTHPTDYYSIAGYASLRGIKVDVSKANQLGRYASRLSKKWNYEVGHVSDARYGQVNTYHLDILKDTFRGIE